MMRQAVPLLRTDAIVGTGLEPHVLKILDH